LNASHGDGWRVGIGSDTGRPSISGLGTPPAAESKPLRERMSFTSRSYCR
jgi:hypothetical protein